MRGKRNLFQPVSVVHFVVLVSQTIGQAYGSFPLPSKSYYNTLTNIM